MQTQVLSSRRHGPDEAVASSINMNNHSAFSWLGASAFNAASVGSKATSLHELLMAGLPVAPGFAVPPEVNVNRLESELETAVGALGGFPVAARSSSSLEGAHKVHEPALLLTRFLS